MSPFWCHVRVASSYSPHWNEWRQLSVIPSYLSADVTHCISAPPKDDLDLITPRSQATASKSWQPSFRDILHLFWKHVSALVNQENLTRLALWYYLKRLNDQWLISLTQSAHAPRLALPLFLSTTVSLCLSPNSAVSQPHLVPWNMWPKKTPESFLVHAGASLLHHWFL